MSICENVTTDFVRELFDYDGENLRWKNKSHPCSHCKIGSVAGYLNYDGYRHIRIRGKIYKAHRLVWLWHHGTWPNPEADHINRIPSDNRIENLREATHQENSENRGIRNDNTSSQTGVSWYKPTKKWVAHIGVGGKQIHLGYFDDFDEACAAREEAKIKYHLFGEEN